MNVRMKTAVAAMAALALTTVGPVASTQASGVHGGHGSKAAKVYTLVPSSPGDNPEGVAWDKRSRQFFVGTVASGMIYRATLRGHTLRPFITPDPADPADSAIGMKVSRGKLYVAGGPTGSIYVYRIRTGALLARFETGAGGFLNDLVVTRRGHVYVTDSFRPILWHVTPRMLRAGSGAPRRINVEPEIAYEPGQFNVNGIVSRRGGRELIVVNSFSQSLYRIRFHEHAPRGIRKIRAPKLEGDGLLIDRGRLLVVTGAPEAVTVLNLSNHHLRARVAWVRTHPSLRGPSTVARTLNRYLVVNADFATGTQPFTVSSLVRRHR